MTVRNIDYQGNLFFFTRAEIKRRNKNINIFLFFFISRRESPAIFRNQYFMITHTYKNYILFGIVNNNKKKNL